MSESLFEQTSFKCIYFLKKVREAKLLTFLKDIVKPTKSI